MLKELKIENLAIIDKLELEFNNGFIALTGETGAGKSIILSGINLLIGEKGNLDMIRDGAETLFAQGVFEITDLQVEELKKAGIEIEDNEIIVTRTLDRSGKGKASINNLRVPMSGLKEVMSQLVDVVGQHSHQMLLQKSNHIKLLDKFLKDDINKVKKEIEESFENYKEIDFKIEKIEKQKKDLEVKKDFLEFQLSEINSVDLKADEDITLEEEYKKLFNAGKIKEKIAIATDSLTNGDMNSLNFIKNSKKALESLVNYSEDFKEVVDRLERVYYELDDIVDIISTLDDDFDLDDRRLEAVISRLDKINKLKLKYGSTVQEILEYRENVISQLRIVEDGTFEIEQLRKEREKVHKNCVGLSQILRKERKKISVEIEKMLRDELMLLNMKEANLVVFFEELEDITSAGMDSIEFYISTNLGQQPKPLSKIASGGEISRIMLGLKVIFSKVDNLAMILFDEIDSGVGGESVKRIGEKLKEIGLTSQVISITHSPAIAAKASQQFYIEKKNIDGRTISSVEELDSNERVLEISRMLAGENASQAVIEHAKELLNG